jgi:cytoskeletal protein RodZ
MSAAEGRRAGALLAAARKKAKLDLAAVSARTRIPQRHLAAIEAGEYGKLPSRTYAVGFSRTYARLLGLDEREVTEQVRLDLEAGDPQSPLRPDRFEPGDPARVPSRRLAWFSALAVVVLVIGAFTFYRTYFSPGLGPPPLTEPTRAAPVNRPEAAAPTAPAPVASGLVVFTSLADGMWIRFYDGAGKRLYEGQMAKGQSFTVPADAVDPKAWTGRPDAFAITVGGRPVPKLAESEGLMKDVPVTAEALTNRAPSPSNTATPPAT